MEKIVLQDESLVSGDNYESLSINESNPESKESFAKAREVIREALVRFALQSDSHRDSRNKLGVGSVIIYRLLAMSMWELVDEGIDTMCVEIKADGLIRLKVNADWIAREGVEMTMRGLAHEMNHIKHPVFCIKSGEGVQFLSEWMKDPLYKEYALEYWNNWCVMRAFGDKEFLDVGDAGEEIGLMNPQKAYKSYREFKKSVSETPVSITQFLLSPEVCYNYLQEMPKPPRQRKSKTCDHGQGEGTDPGSNPSGIDVEEAESIMDKVFDNLMDRALRGDEAAKDALLDVGEQFGGEGSKFWSDMGLGALLGKPVPSMKIRFWETFLQNSIGSRLVPGLSMAFPKKEAGLAPFYEEMGSGIPLRPMGKETERIVWGFIDTSGSMPEDLVNRCLALAGEIEGCETKWHTFATSVVESPDPTIITYDRGGTDFTAIDKFIMEAEDIPDCILIITDGHAPPIWPSWSEEAIWVITENGSTWMEDAMTTIVSDIPSSDV
jgi:hypothetical protein